MYKRNILENALIKLSNPQLKKFDLDNVNIEDLFNLALRHDVFSIVYLNVSRQEEFKKLIKKEYILEYYSLKRRKKIIKDTLQDFIDMAEKEHIEIMLLKGIVLDSEIYNGCRDYSDIDIAVDDDNFFKLLLLFHNLGYSCSVKGDISILKSIYNNSSHRLFEFYKYKDGNIISFDLHKICKENPECLDSIYDDSIKKGSVHYPNIIDSLIFACFHAWRHYPHTFRIISGTKAIVLKDLMDIKMLYTKICETIGEVSIYKRAHEIEAINVLIEMLYITEIILGSFVSKQYEFYFIPNINHNYESIGQETTFESRFFNPSKDRDFVKSQITNRLSYLNSGSDIICCSIYNSGLLNNNAVICYLWKDLFGSTINIPRNKFAIAKFYWDESSFFIHIDLFTSCFKKGGNMVFDECQDSIELIFPDDEITISFQPKTNNRFSVFMVKKDSLIKPRISNCFFQMKIKENIVHMKLQIPWNITNICISKSHRFKMYLNIKMGNIKNFGKQIIMPFGKSTYVKLIS